MKLEKNQLNKNQNDDVESATNFSDTKYKQLSLDEKENYSEGACNLENEEISINKKKNEEQVQLKIEENATTEEKEKLEEAQETVKKQSTKKKKWLSLIFLFINIGVVAGVLTYQVLNENNVSPFATFASRINWGIVVLIAVVFAIIMLLETLKFSILTYKVTGKRKLSLCYKVSAIGRYYDNITPFAAGGQPFQIYYFNRHGIPAAESLSLPMGKYVIWQLSFVTFTFVIMMFSISLPNFTNAGSAIVTASSWIGFAINSALVLLVGLISISRKIGTALIGGILKLFHKMKIVKDYDKQYNKVMKLVDNYQTTMRKYAKDKWNFILGIFLAYLTSLLHYSLPFLVYAAFYGFNFAYFFPIITYCVMIDLAASFLPLPGGTGAAELSFTALFGMYFFDGNLFWAMIIWRIFTYYAYIIQGLLVIVYDYLIGNKKFQWEEKKCKLEAESRTFENNYLKDFELSLEKSNKPKNKKERKL